MTLLLRRGFAVFALCAALLVGVGGARADQAADAADAQSFMRTMADKALVLVSASQPAVLRHCFYREGEWMKPGDTVAWLSDEPDEPLPAEGDTTAEELLVGFDVT